MAEIDDNPSTYHLLEYIGQYKVIAALFTLCECGILSELQRGKRNSVAQLAQTFELEQTGLQLIFDVLEQAAFLIKASDNTYSLTPLMKATNALEIIALESRLFENVFSVDRLKLQLKNYKEVACKNSIDSTIKQCYFNSFQQLAQLITLKAFRQLKSTIPVGLHCDLSRPSGHWEQTFSKVLQSNHSFFSKSIGFHKKEKIIPLTHKIEMPIASLFLFNSFRWLYKYHLEEMRTLWNNFHRDGLFIISDIFLDGQGEKNLLKTQINLEWWAMSQCGIEDKKNLAKHLWHEGFKLINQTPIDDLFDLMVFKKI